MNTQNENKLDELKEYREKLSKLSEEEKKQRDLYLKKLADGTIQGPPTGYPSIDKQWLKYYSDEAIESVSSKNISLFEHLLEENKNRLNNIAISYFNIKITYKKLFKQIQKTINSFEKMGIKPNDNATLCMPNTPEFIYVFYALNHMGVNIQLVDAMTKLENINEFLERNNSNIYITYMDNLKELPKFANLDKILAISPVESLPFIIKTIINSKNKITFKDEKIILWDKFFKDSNNSKINELDNISGNVVVNTGGTTGKPKGVVLTNNSINSVVDQYKNSGLLFAPKDTMMFNIPNCLAYGFIISMHLPLSLGMNLQVVPMFNPEEYPELIVKYKPNHIIGIPDWYQQMCNSSKLEKMNCSFIKTAASGGAPMNQELKNNANKWFENHGSKAKIIEGYGMTELSSSAVTNLENVNVAHSVGVPLFNNNVMIYDSETGKEVLTGKSGEVLVNGPSMMNGYLNNDKETKKTIQSHYESLWVHTDDIGHIDSDGRLFVEGRKKRIIETYTTHKIYSESIEELIMSNNKVDKCAIISIPDIEHGKGFLPKAIIQIKSEYYNYANEVIDEIKALCCSSLEEYCVPSDYEIVDNIPFNSNNKIDYPLLEKMELEKSTTLSK